jgi:hypothetical protein
MSRAYYPNIFSMNVCLFRPKGVVALTPLDGNPGLMVSIRCVGHIPSFFCLLSLHRFCYLIPDVISLFRQLGWFRLVWDDLGVLGTFT